MACILSSTFHPTDEQYEPTPRYSHDATVIEGRCYLWGGCVLDFSESDRRMVASTVEIFDPKLQTWERHSTTGVPPPGLCDGACTSLLDSLYWFGGDDGKYLHNSLYCLDTTTLEWRKVQPLNKADGPMGKILCGMVSFLQDHLAIFGGYGIPTGPIQPGATFIQRHIGSGIGLSNELQVFDITTSM